MNEVEARKILESPAASPKEKEAAQRQLTALVPTRTRDDVLIRELLLQSGVVKLSDVTEAQMISFRQTCHFSEEVERIHRIRAAMLTTAFWNRYLASSGAERERTAQFISLLYPNAGTAEQRQTWADAELAEARKTLADNGWERW